MRGVSGVQHRLFVRQSLNAISIQGQQKVFKANSIVTLRECTRSALEEAWKTLLAPAHHSPYI